MDNTQVTRRTLFSVGGLLLLSACSGTDSTRHPADSASSAPQPGGAPPTLPGDSHSGQAPGPASGKAPSAAAPEFYVHDGPKTIALTIDDGPSPEWTPQALRLLRRYGITATFCQVGALAEANPSLVREVAADGHQIANHTWNHADLAKLTAAQVRSQLERTSDRIEAISGHRPRLFRAPYGAWSRDALATCGALEMRPLDWSVDPRDWARPGTQNIVRTILQTTRPGSIILEHDGGGDRSQTVAALRIALPRLLDEGYHFVTP